MIKEDMLKGLSRPELERLALRWGQDAETWKIKYECTLEGQVEAMKERLEELEST